MGKSTLSMARVNNYVSLPEGSKLYNYVSLPEGSKL
jgi:hypothetical protein